MSDVVVSREKLEQIFKKAYKRAAPWTGEYAAGQADLANELLGNEAIDWNMHPNYNHKLREKRRSSERNVRK